MASGSYPEEGGGSGTVDAVVPGDGINVDDTDPANPVISASSLSGIPYWIAKGLQRTGLSARDAAFDSSDFLETASASNVWWTISGTIANPATVKGGVLQINTAGTSSIVRPSTWGPIARATTPFYLYTRFKCASAPTTTQLGRAGLLNSPAASVGFYIGAFGPSLSNMDGSHYGALTYDGVTSTGYLSTISIDTGYHDIELWYDGTAFKFAVDNETPITIAGNLPASSVYMLPFFEGNGANTYQWDMFLALSGRE